MYFLGLTIHGLAIMRVIADIIGGKFLRVSAVIGPLQVGLNIYLICEALYLYQIIQAENIKKDHYLNPNNTPHGKFAFIKSGINRFFFHVRNPER